MLKNLKTALSRGEISSSQPQNETDFESKKRRKAKAKEAANGTQNGVAVGRQLAVVVKSHKFLSVGDNKKSLGSKKLANVMCRLRLITSGRRNKIVQFANTKTDTLENYDQAVKLMLEEQTKQQDGDDDDDNLSFHSAQDFLDDQHSKLVVNCKDAGEQNCTFNGYLNDSKFILPEEQCDIPTFLHTQNCQRQLIDETRRLLRERHEANPESFYDHDYKLMLEDDWTVTRFLLRRRLDPARTSKLMEECGKFRKQYLMSEMKLWEFPREFHQAGGLFKYAPDRVGNQTLYMRVKMYRRVPEISDVFKAFILCALEECDVANRGRGTAVIFDLSDCGLQNVDLGFLYWLLNSFRNYCPKGVSYILVYNLPWFLSATCKLAMTWLSETNRRALRFVNGLDELENFIARNQLPDYLGGTCGLSYRKIPAGSRPAIEICDRLDLTETQALKIKELFKEYLNDPVEEEEEAGAEKQLKEAEPEPEVASSNQDTASASSSRASTTDIAHAIRNTPLVRNSSADSLVPVVQLVTKASKFIA